MQVSVLPRHPFTSMLDRPIRADEEDALLLFYQPIMGNASYSLYHLLKREADLADSGKPHTHRWLLSMLGMTMEGCLEARYRLEGLGLLQTFQRRSNASPETSSPMQRSPSSVPSTHGGLGLTQEGVLYRVLPPLTPAGFFDSDILSVLLLNRLGEESYRQLRACFLKEDWVSSQQVVDVSKSFQDVFPPLSPRELSQVSEKPQRPLQERREKPAVRAGAGFDLAWMKVRVGRVFQLEQWWDREAEQRVLELAYLYQLTEEEMALLIQEHLFSREAIDWALLRLEIQNKAGQTRVAETSLLFSEAQEETSAVNQENDSDALRHRQDLERISPYALLQAYQNGSKVADSDLRLVRSLLEDFQLNERVANVLIEYVMFTNDYKLPRALVEKVASHWKRLGIKSVEQAQKLCRQEHQMYKGWPRLQNQRNKKRYQRREPIPEAVEQQMNRQHGEKIPNLLPDTLTGKGSANRDQQVEKNRLMQEKEQRARSLLQALGELKNK